MITPEQKARLSKLSPEQQTIAEKWDKEREEMDAVFEKLRVSIEAKDNTLFREAMADMAAKTPSMCEHERSIWSNCAGCDEIEQALHPELFCAECGVPFSMMEDLDDLVSHNEGDICPDCEYEKEHA